MNHLCSKESSKQNIKEPPHIFAKKIRVGSNLMFSFLEGQIVDLKTMKFYKIPPISARLFSCLLINANKIITRNDLMKKVWGDYGFVVGSNSINQAICVLREILETVEPGSRYIRTIPRIGYCFVGIVSILSE